MPLRKSETPSTAVERALNILEAVAQRSQGMSNAELARRLDIPKSSASYILRTLEQRGYLRRDSETNRYKLGLQVLSIGRGALAGLDLRELAQPFFRQLVEQTGITAHLAILDHGTAVYIEKVDAPGFIKVDTWIGRRLEIYTTAVGKALVAWLNQGDVQEIVRARGGLKRRTPKTITSLVRFHKELEQIRGRGFAIDDEENSAGVRCIAAPVFNQAGEVEAAIGISGPTSQVSQQVLPKLADQVLQAARSVSVQLGYRMPHR